MLWKWAPKYHEWLKTFFEKLPQQLHNHWKIEDQHPRNKNSFDETKETLVFELFDFVMIAIGHTKDNEEDDQKLLQVFNHLLYKNYEI